MPSQCDQLPFSPLPLFEPMASASPSHNNTVTEHPPNSSHGPLPSDNPLSALPSDVSLEILEKIPAPTLNCSNIFSILENCTLADPTLSTYNLKRLQAAPPKVKRTILEQVSVSGPSTISSSFPPSPSLPIIDTNSDIPLLVDLSPFKMKARRKPKGKALPSSGPQSSGLPPKIIT